MWNSIHFFNNSRYLSLFELSLGLTAYMLLQHGHLFLNGPTPPLSGIHMSQTLHLPCVKYGAEYLPRLGFGNTITLQLPLHLIPIL